MWCCSVHQKDREGERDGDKTVRITPQKNRNSQVNHADDDDDDNDPRI